MGTSESGRKKLIINQKHNPQPVVLSHTNSNLRKYRNEFLIMADMLNSASEGRVNKTRIMYSAYLSYAQLQQYFPKLIDNGFLLQDGVYFVLTPKGRLFISKCQEIRTLLNGRELQSNNQVK